jgi:hypothetical protein
MLLEDSGVLLQMAANANIPTVITNICAVAFTGFNCMVAARVMYPSLKKNLYNNYKNNTIYKE